MKRRGKSKAILQSVQKVTTVHGTSQFGSWRGRQLAAWSVIIIGNVALTAGYLVVIKHKFNENQIVTQNLYLAGRTNICPEASLAISAHGVTYFVILLPTSEEVMYSQIDANCKVSQVPFPAVSICNFNMVSIKESANIEAILKKNSKSESEIEEFFVSIPHLKDYNKDSRSLSNFTGILDILKRHFFTMDTIMEEVHQKCENLLLHCTFNRKPKKCSDIFRLIKTLEGYCCAFNYAALNDNSEVSLLPPDQDMEYYDDQNEDSSTGRIIMTSESGSSSGLSVVFNVEPSDYQSSTPRIGAKIMVSDPNDYPETTILYRYVEPGESLDVKVEAMVFQSSSDLRRVAPENRGCWFYDEVRLEHTDRYSFETCNTECRMKMYVDHCACIPYKYPRSEQNRICEFEDLKCLNNVTVHISRAEMNCQPPCYMECRDKKYSITSDVGPFVADRLPTETTDIGNTSELATLQVYFSKSNCNCYKMYLLIDLNYFIATYGGVLSLFFGASILTLFELGIIFCTAIAKSIWQAVIVRQITMN